jgi:histone H1/5
LEEKLSLSGPNIPLKGKISATLLLLSTMPPKTRAVSKSPKKATHPTYESMIISAIGTLRDRGGSSQAQISKYIQGEFENLPEDEMFKRQLRLGFRRAMDNEVIERVKASYKLTARGKREYTEQGERSARSKSPKRKTTARSSSAKTAKTPTKRAASTKAAASKPKTTAKTTGVKRAASASTKKTTTKKTATTKATAKPSAKVTKARAGVVIPPKKVTAVKPEHVANGKYNTRAFAKQTPASKPVRGGKKKTASR